MHNATGGMSDVDFTLYINRDESLTSARAQGISLSRISVERPSPCGVEQVLVFRPRISSITSTAEQYAPMRLMHIDLPKSRAYS